MRNATTPATPARTGFDYLAGFGFDEFFFTRGAVRPLQEFHPAEHGDPTSEGYVNNFFFRPREAGTGLAA